MKKIRLFLVLIILFLPSMSSPLTLNELLNDLEGLPKVKIAGEKPKEVYEKIKAVQIFVLPAKPELEKAFVSWKDAGVNSLILRVFHNSGDRYHYNLKTDLKSGVYFKTKNAPVVLDVLGEFISMAKMHGFKVFPWMTTRYANYDAPQLGRMIGYSFSQKTVVETKGMDVFSPDVQAHIIGLFSDLSLYPIDGVLLQDDLFVRHNEGFSRAAAKQFRDELGFDPDPKRFFTVANDKVGYQEEFWTWRRWKSKKIAGLVEQLSKTVKSRNPGAKLFVNLTYEAVSHPKGALAWLAHDIEDFKGVADYFSLMAYHRQIMDELKIDFQAASNYLNDMVKRCSEIFPDEPQRFLFKLQVKDWNTNQPINEEEIRALLYRAPAMENLSIAVVPYPPNISGAIMKEIFNKRPAISFKQKLKH